MANNQFHAIGVAPSWAACTNVYGGPQDGSLVIVVTFKDPASRREAPDSPLTDCLHQTFPEPSASFGPFSMTLQNAIELRRMLNIAIDQALIERRLIEGDQL